MSWTFELLMKPPRGVPLTEGPVWDGEQLLFTHIQASSILRLDVASGAITTWRTGTNRTNGLAFDSQGRLFGCCSGGRSLLRFDACGVNTVISDSVDGRRLNTPNDLAIDRQGRIWFSNPINAGNWDKTETTELPDQSVLRCDPQPDGSYTATRATFDTTMPNGVLLSQDQRTLYVAESGYTKGVPRELRAYPILDDGSLGTFSTLFTWDFDRSDGITPGAIDFVGRQHKANGAGAKVTAAVSIGPREGGGFGLAVVLTVEDPTLPQALLETLAHEAHDTICPYSHATRGNVDVTLVIKGG
jgi:gluconolactonase